MHSVINGKIDPQTAQSKERISTFYLTDLSSIYVVVVIDSVFGPSSTSIFNNIAGSAFAGTGARMFAGIVNLDAVYFIAYTDAHTSAGIDNLNAVDSIAVVANAIEVAADDIDVTVHATQVAVDSIAVTADSHCCYCGFQLLLLRITIAVFSCEHLLSDTGTVESLVLVCKKQSQIMLGF